MRWNSFRVADDSPRTFALRESMDIRLTAYPPQSCLKDRRYGGLMRPIRPHFCQSIDKEG